MQRLVVHREHDGSTNVVQGECRYVHAVDAQRRANWPAASSGRFD
jgi:hypothetical protein